MHKFRLRFIIAFCFGAVLTLAFWLLTDPYSPLPPDLKASPKVATLIAIINIGPMIVEYLVSHNPHRGNDAVGWTAVLIQWTIIGLIGSSAWLAIRGRKH